ncbi:MAG: hypothetical protein ACXWE7_14490 [Nitrososphaeraceae archaeon]
MSKFSISAQYKDKEKPDINTIGELKLIFPGLHNHGLKEGKLKKVNGFEAKEISCKIGKIFFDDNSEEDNQIRTDLNFWYLPNDERIPLIVEFTFDYNAKKRKNDKDIDKLLKEEFSLSLVQSTYKFYRALQETRIVDLESSKTKTSFAYDYKQ